MATPQTIGTECRACKRIINEGARFCACGVPTALASFKDRAEYETKLWRQHKASRQG